ncbi:MAG: Low-specificity L-threonine aldolase [uncultured Chloroflexi bacterium]|uniref:Low-specificity L-threonine aldolase n=1 Tax=uncultured Chloroflexota bacterium TaxID=166587 RepID=A0A6J4IDT0_9CHLR|nr:MAG: Low-specificity L-threonine aldolase [uncultured Chloroflexota bacterium]
MPDRTIDLRSDTVTHPTPAMREAMYGAELGDDVYGEDPTVNRLEELSAERLGKEAAVMLLSGTMGNLVGILAQTRHGDEAIVGAHSHIFLNEAGGPAALGGVQLHTVPTQRGVMTPDAVEGALRDPRNLHHPRSTLVCIENTHNRDGGAAVPVQAMDTVADVAHRNGLRVHVDGARLFNAAVALDVPIARLVRGADTVQFCLSKGLGCPAGSLLVGDAAVIQEARRWRKMIGGGLRQSGIIAAAGVVALEQMVDRLAEDHRNAKRLAQGLNSIPGLVVDVDAVDTNIIMLDVDDQRVDPKSFVARLREQGVKIGSPYGPRIRLVTHYQVTSDDVDFTLRAAEHALDLVAA